MRTRSSPSVSPSRYGYTSRKTSSQSAMHSLGLVRVDPIGIFGRVGCLGEEVPALSEAEQPTLQAFSSPVEPRHHRADGDVEDLGDLLVREVLDVGEQDGQAEVLREVFQRPLDLVVGEQIEQRVLGAATGLDATDPL